MIGIGMPSSQNSTPLPKPKQASVDLTTHYLPRRFRSSGTLKSPGKRSERRAGLARGALNLKSTSPCDVLGLRVLIGSLLGTTLRLPPYQLDLGSQDGPDAALPKAR